ncbi:cadherin-related family member 2 isoform X2 [Triplophysa rosa]|uniref:cadherin-related family member 2 isoform X2 n=1 Tax=Triplophysa rosa TaxID=992332 RepID=UPI002545E8BE|nr:cadherin-related family member 2 isoform X2 [Triplophysa rosa]
MLMIYVYNCGTVIGSDALAKGLIYYISSSYLKNNTCGNWVEERLDTTDIGKMGKTVFLLFGFIASFYCQFVPVIDMSMQKVQEDIPNGEVRIKNQLDRETNELFPVVIAVNDGVHPSNVTKSVYIAVDDANDNAPIFLNIPYNREVPENTPVGTTIFTATATDADLPPASTVTYKIDEVVPNDGYELFSISGPNGHVVLEGPLNFTEKSPFYQIRVNATDGGGLLGGVIVNQSTEVTAFITIKDVPDMDPQFLNLPNMVTIYENSPVDTSVFTVKARDPDTGINDPIRYSIEPTNPPDLFQIIEKDGKITVQSEFDREALLDIVGSAVVELKIKASETNPNVNGVIASTVQTLQITIGDVNDNGPDFYECEGDTCTKKNSFTGNVDEHSSVGVAVAALNIRVKDPDQGENSKFVLHLDGPDKDAFSVTPSSGVGDSSVQVTIKDSNTVDFEIKRTMSVQIIAKDANADLTVSASVTININDMNDNIPEFEKEFYIFSVDEHCKNGTIVDTITATDADELDDGKITYKLVPNSILTRFDVFENNGTIYVKNGELLDREGTSSYTATLQAIDSVGKIGTTVLEINLRDINDQTPVMNRDVYDAFVQEDQNLKLVIQARDGDEPETPNSKIQYHIEDSLFSSNFTIGLYDGVLENNGLLDREAIDPQLNGVIELKVIALDMGKPPKNSSAMVFINVGDVNDNSPVYLHSTYTFKVKESEGGILVGSVLAHDVDQTDFNNRIFFTIDNSFGSFIILSEPYSEGYRGNLTVDPVFVLDYESGIKTYHLKVVASDLGEKTAVTTVEVVVEDVNDTPPVFQAGLTLNVKENTSLPGPLGTIKGSDVDTEHLLEYMLVSAECHCSGIREPCPEEWFSVELNGNVVGNSGSTSVVIDYEKCDKAFLTAKVVDVKTEKGKNSTEGVVTINIEDINDNAPEFIIMQEFYVVLLERVEKDSSVGKVYAYDRDTGENRKINFKVIKVEFVSSEGTLPQDLFLYTDSNAQEDPDGRFLADIRSQKQMASDQRGKFMVEVQAFNPDGLSSTSVVELLTIDSSYKVSLRFRSPVSEVNENLPQIRQILTSVTRATVNIFNVASETTTQRAEEVTVLEAYFVFSNGSALDYNEVNRILNSEEVYMEYGVILTQLGFTGISTTTEGQKEVKTEVFIMIGLMAALAIILVVTTTSLVCIRRNYKRKLKACKAMNSAAAVVIENQKSGPVVPGTNKYTREGANPVLNMNIDTATDLGFDEDRSSADRDSLNSLDYNIDMAMIEKDTMPMMIIEEEEEEGIGSPYIEPLGAALAQREKKRGGESPTVTFENPSMNTTDL